MSSADLWEDGYPHGTVEGYDGGCRGGACPADAEIGMSCKRAKALAAGDFRYNRLVAAGKTPAEIAATIDGRDIPADPPAPKSAPKPKAKTKPPADVEAAAPITETPAEVSIAGSAPTATTSAGPTDPPESTTPTPEEDAMPEAPLTTEKFTSGLNQRARTFILRNIREWARANGFPGVPSHGRIPHDALAAFDRAHPHGIVGPETTDTSRSVDGHVQKLRDIVDWARQNGHPDLSMLDITDEIRQAYIDATSQTAEDVAAPEDVAAAPDEKAVEPRPFSADIGDVRERAGLTISGGSVNVELPITIAGDPRDPEAVEAEALASVPGPEWATVTVSEDVERARNLAVRLEGENAHLLEQLAIAHRAVETLLTIHGQSLDNNDVLREQLANMTDLARRRGAHIAFDRSTARLTKIHINELEQQVSDLQEDLAAARTPWWKRATR